MGGGVRSVEDCERLFALGVRYAVLGTAAVRTPEVVDTLCARFPGRIVVAVDARDGRVAVQGWTEATAFSASRPAFWPGLSPEWVDPHPGFALFSLRLQRGIALP